MIKFIILINKIVDLNSNRLKYRIKSINFDQQRYKRKKILSLFCGLINRVIYLTDQAKCIVKNDY